MRSSQHHSPFVASIHAPLGQDWPSEKYYSPPFEASFVHPLPTPPADQSPPLRSYPQHSANVAAAVAYPHSMVPAPDHMGAPTSFTARRPNASNLPSFELPPPPLTSYHHGAKYSYGNAPSHQSATTLTSVGNLLTPPSNSSADGLSPGSSGITTNSSISTQGTVPHFTPTGSGMWPPPISTGTTPYGYHSNSAPPFGPGRELFSPSLNSIVRGASSPSASNGLPPPPPYEIPQYSASAVSAPSLPPAPSHHQIMGSAMMGGHSSASASVTQASPATSQEAFARHPPTPTYYSSQPSSTPQQASFSYSTGPSPVQQSPGATGGSIPKMSPANGHGHIPPLNGQPPQYAQQRPYSYSLPGPVLTNVNNPNGQLALVGGMQQHGMMPGYNSGHAAQMQQMYSHPQQHSPQNERPFRCDQCPQSFNRNHDLKRHKRIHLAVKPFPCGHCEKSFSRKDALKRHILVKGCGKAGAMAEVKELDGSESPVSKTESVHASPMITASA